MFWLSPGVLGILDLGQVSDEYTDRGRNRSDCKKKPEPPMPYNS